MVQIRYKNLEIDKIEQSSGIFTGNNYQSDWSHTSKKNEGFGSLSGDKSVSIGNHSVLKDPDQEDEKSPSK